MANLIEFLRDKGHEITFELEKNLDLIFIIWNLPYKYKEKVLPVLKYIKKKKHRKTKILQRVNISDISKNVNNQDKVVFKINRYADETIFISNWLANYFLKKGFNKKYQVIYNGCNEEYFYPNNKKELGEVINLVTHHWSSNWMKGFDIYTELDKIIEDRNDINFTYVGNYYNEFTPKNTKIIPPLYGMELGNELRKHDIYLTAARWESCGMHHIEGARCGLPVLFHKDGGA